LNARSSGGEGAEPCSNIEKSAVGVGERIPCKRYMLKRMDQALLKRKKKNRLVALNPNKKKVVKYSMISLGKDHQHTKNRGGKDQAMSTQKATLEAIHESKSREEGLPPAGRRERENLKKTVWSLGIVTSILGGQHASLRLCQRRRTTQHRFARQGGAIN